jgi:Methyltransferase domain
MDDKIETVLRESCPECGQATFPLQFVLEHSHFDKTGYVIELGVASGRTINLIGNHLPDNSNIFGFDCFEGLPEPWNDGGKQYPKGAFSTNGIMPRVPPNVRLIKGLFEDTLPAFKKDVLNDSPIALLHVDSDIYSSAKCAFTVFRNNIVEGTVIVFDELWNYPGYKEHELKAFSEFLEDSGLWFEPLVCRQRSFKNLCNKEVAVVISKR